MCKQKYVSIGVNVTLRDIKQTSCNWFTCPHINFAHPCGTYLLWMGIKSIKIDILLMLFLVQMIFYWWHSLFLVQKSICLFWVIIIVLHIYRWYLDQHENSDWTVTIWLGHLGWNETSIRNSNIYSTYHEWPVFLTR